MASTEEVEVHLLLLLFLLGLLLLLLCGSTTAAAAAAAAATARRELAIACRDQLVGLLAIHLLDHLVQQVVVDVDAASLEDFLHLVSRWGCLAAENSEQVGAQVLH